MMYPRPYVPTLRLRGSSPYEIGLQHGQLAREQIRTNIKTYTSFFQETAGLENWEEAKKRSTVFISTIERLYPEILDEIQGIADGAGLEKEDILALNVRSEIGLTNYENAPPKAGEGEEEEEEGGPPAITDGCTAIAQLSKDKSTLVLAQNWDWLEELHEGMVILDIAADNKGVCRMQFLNEAGLVGKIGLNSYGVGICMNALRCGALATDRLPTHIMARRVLQYAKSFDEAVDMLNEFGGACTFNLVVADIEGKFGNIEVSPNGISILTPLDPGKDVNVTEKKKKNGGRSPEFVAHTNHVITPATFFPRGAIYDRPAPNSFARLDRMTELTRQDIANNVVLTMQCVNERLKDQQGTPLSICRDVPADATGMEKMTTLATVLMEFNILEKNARVRITIGRPCEEGLQNEDWVFEKI